LKEESYAVIGVCMEVQNILGYGFSEIIYKDAIEAEFIDNGIRYLREEQLSVCYKGKWLKHRFVADFVVFDKIILEIKSTDKGITEEYISQTLNYLRVSGNNVALIVNFGKQRLDYKRLIVD
jgi:GxxExxY protein